LAQNFAKAFDVQYLNKENKLEYVWATSWGVSTRLIGALIMTHSDDNGLVLPPALAPIQVVIVPIFRKAEQKEALMEYVDNIYSELKKAGVTVKLDDSEHFSPGYKFAEYEMQGVPLRIAVGPRDMENNAVEMARRDTLTKEVISRENLTEKVLALMVDIQRNLLENASKMRDGMSKKVDSWDEFKEAIKNEGGFLYAHWDGTTETEGKIKEETKATIRLIPLDAPEEEGKCVYSGKPSKRRVVFAKAY
jgi:prolyl-tRNA synthetase